MSKQVRIQSDTHLALTKWKSPGQSYDGAIKELLLLQDQTINNEVEA